MAVPLRMRPLLGWEQLCLMGRLLRSMPWLQLEPLWDRTQEFPVGRYVWVWVCVYVCVCMCMYICVCVCPFNCACMHLCLSVWAWKIPGAHFAWLKYFFLIDKENLLMIKEGIHDMYKVTRRPKKVARRHKNQHMCPT